MSPKPIKPADVDREYIAAQLGREPRGLIAVAARDKLGNASSIMNHPIQWDGQSPLPFPTLYWLVDPVLSAKISDIERRGWIGQLEQAIAEDASLQAKVHADHRTYAARRWAVLDDDEQRLAIEQGFATTLRDKGVGGTANFDKLKCLHMHAAYHLAQIEIDGRGTAVGRLLTQREPGFFGELKTDG